MKTAQFLKNVKNLRTEVLSRIKQDERTAIPATESAYIDRRGIFTIEIETAEGLIYQANLYNLEDTEFLTYFL